MKAVAKVVVWAVVLTALARGGWWFLFKKDNADASQEIQPEIVEVERGDLRVIVEATGQVVPNSKVEVKSKASGEIISLPFKEGEYVEAGQLLVELDPDDERRNVQRAESNLRNARARAAQASSELALMESDAGRILAQAEANLRQAEAQLEDARARLERRRGLHSEGVLSEEELDAAETAYQQALSNFQNAQAAHADAQNYPLNIELRRQDLVLAEIQVHDAEIALEEAQERFEDTRIVAPVSGVITDLQVERGQIIASGISNVGGGTTLMVISDLSRLFIEVKVDETDIGKVQVGSPCEIIADAFPEYTFRGVVDWIAPQGTKEQNIVTFDVKVEINLDQVSPEIAARLRAAVADDSRPANEALGAWGLRPNMTARVQVIAADLHDVLLLPNEAIQRGEDGGRYVEVVTGEASAEASTADALSRRPAQGQSQDAQRRSARGNGPPTAGRFEGRETEVTLPIAPRPPTVRREVVLGATDGLLTQIISGVEEGERVLVPIPEWRLEFLRQQATGETPRSSDRRRRGLF